jgi:hypothetical protein
MLNFRFNGQILLAHECFYEFHESTKFIALIDWDDLLLTTQFKTLGEAFASALATKPTAGYLLINKLESTFNIQGLFNLKKKKMQKLLKNCFFHGK